MKNHVLSRRTLLRGALGGAAVVVGLPPLEAMLDSSGTALADGTPIPKKFGFWFFGNGVVQNQWNPAAAGAGFPLSPALQPLAGVKDYLSVVSKTWVPGHHPTAHWSQYGALRRASDSGGPSADDVILDHLAPGAKFRSLDLRISRCANGAYTADEYEGNPVPGFLVDPQVLYQQLFYDFMPTSEPAPPGLKNAKLSVLDAVLADAKAMRARLGKADQHRLDAHIESVSDIEKRLLSETAYTCTLPTDPGPRPPDEPGLREPLEEVNQAMSDLVAYAFACDLSRSFRIYFTTVQTEVVLWQVGVSKNQHAFGHENPMDAAKIQEGVVFTMKQLAYLLERLRATSVGDGNLLDHACIWTTSEITAPNVHDSWSIPTLLVGKAGGALRGDYHYDAGGNPDGNYKTQVPAAIHGRVPLTAMRALDMDVDGFGSGSARGESPIGELMTSSG
jgi:hypothetical protein